MKRKTKNGGIKFFKNLPDYDNNLYNSNYTLDFRLRVSSLMNSILEPSTSAYEMNSRAPSPYHFSSNKDDYIEYSQMSSSDFITVSNDGNREGPNPSAYRIARPILRFLKMLDMSRTLV